MNVLRDIRAYFSPRASAAVLSTAEKVTAQKAAIGAEVVRLMADEGADVHSAVGGSCLYYGSKLRQTLLPVQPDLQLRKAFNSGAETVHYHLRTPEDVIVDPTWLQWIENAPADLPRVFVGTREELVGLIRPFAHLLPKRYPMMAQSRRMTPEEFVDVYYGFGQHTAEDVTDTPLANAHRDPRTQAFRE